MPCDGPFCGQCTADYNAAKPCCGQDKHDLRAMPDLRPCPESLPSCVEYVYRQHYGRCTSKTLEAERKRQFEIDRRRAKQIPPPPEETAPGSDLVNPWEGSPTSVDQPKNAWEKGEALGRGRQVGLRANLPGGAGGAGRRAGAERRQPMNPGDGGGRALGR